MNTNQRKTLQAVFEDPIRADIVWSRIESMLIAAGVEVHEARGSRVLVKIGGRRAVFHRPHPRKEAARGAVRLLRMLLRDAGITPSD